MNQGWKQKAWVLYRVLARLRMLLTPDRVYETPEGERYLVNRYSFVERSISEGGFEKARVEFLRRLLGPDDVFVDIGGNIGLFTVLAARCGATVESFEPDPFNYRRLARNVALNGFAQDQVSLHQFALGDKTGHVTLRRPLNDNYGMSSIVASHAPDGTEVLIRRLDDILALSAKRFVVKIDVEGAELQVLDGARVTLEKMKEGSLWLVEIHITEGIEVESVAQRFRQLGYGISYFDDDTGKIINHATPGTDPLLIAQRH
jgi:FkbM family methyltransferase